MDVELLAVPVSWSKFKLMVWISLAVFVASYIGARIDTMRKHKQSSIVLSLFLSSILPVILIYIGYSTHLNNFYAIKIKANNAVELLFVYPEGKSVLLHNVSSFIKPQRGDSCILIVKSGEERFESVMASSRDICKQVKHALKADT